MDYTKLAKRIKIAGADIAKDHVNKDYLLECTYRDTIVVTSDSGFEAIAIGDIGRAEKGYMYLYHKETPKRNSFPSEKKLASLLKDVADRKILEEGEGKASYHFYKGVSISRQVEYFADIVKRMAADDCTCIV